MCVCVFLCFVNFCGCEYEHQRLVSGVILIPDTLFFQDRVSLNPKVINVDELAGQSVPETFLTLPPSAPELQMHTHMPYFFVGAVNPTSDPNVCPASSLPWPILLCLSPFFYR